MQIIRFVNMQFKYSLTVQIHYDYQLVVTVWGVD